MSFAHTVKQLYSREPGMWDLCLLQLCFTMYLNNKWNCSSSTERKKERREGVWGIFSIILINFTIDILISVKLVSLGFEGGGICTWITVFNVAKISQYIMLRMVKLLTRTFHLLWHLKWNRNEDKYLHFVWISSLF